MSNSKITTALLLATTAFVSMPASTLAANLGGRVGKRIHPRHSDRQTMLKRRALKPGTDRVGGRVMKPENQIQKKQMGAVGARALKLRKPAGSMGIRASKPKAVGVRIRPVGK